MKKFASCFISSSFILFVCLVRFNALLISGYVTLVDIITVFTTNVLVVAINLS